MVNVQELSTHSIHTINKQRILEVKTGTELDHILDIVSCFLDTILAKFSLHIQYNYIMCPVLRF